MKKLLVLIMLVGVAFQSFAQSSQQTTVGVTLSHHEAVYATSTPKMFAVPILADVKIIPGAATSFKVESSIHFPSIGQGESKSTYYSNISSMVNDKIEELKSQALFEFSEATGADIILSPMYSVKTIESIGQTTRIVIKIKGYPAKYDNFRSLKAEDRELITTSDLVEGNNQRQTINTVTKKESVVKKEVER